MKRTITHIKQLVEWDDAAEFIQLSTEQYQSISALVKAEHWVEANYILYEDPNLLVSLLKLKDREGR